MSPSAGRRKKRDVALLAGAWLAFGLAGCASDPAAAQHAKSAVPSDAMADPARGELLYQSACAACHSKQTHWRGRHRGSDWAGLLEQVTQWQTVAGQNWNAEEIEDVSAYLNRRFYGLPCPLPRCSAGTVGLLSY
jgi:mono/diheme cytochrome c family protein